MAKKKKRKIASGVWILLFLAVVLVVVVKTVPIFEIRTVLVEGNNRLTAEEIGEAAHVPLGTNMFCVRMGDIEKRVEEMPYVKSAEVSRRLLDKVRIRIEERQEAAAVKLSEGYAVIDDGGRVLRLTLDEEDMLILSGVSVQSAIVGQDVQMEEGQSADSFFDMLTKLCAACLLEDISAISIPSSIDVQLKTRGGMEIYLGSMEDIEYKLKLVGRILHGEYDGIDTEGGGVLRWTSEGQFSYRQSET